MAKKKRKKAKKKKHSGHIPLTLLKQRLIKLSNVIRKRTS